MKKTIPLIYCLLLPLALLSGCATAQQKAWNHYEEGMLLVFKGYDASKDRVDQVEKNYLKALEFNPKLPAVNASLGTYKAKKGDAASANLYFQKEAELHPDAAKAILLIMDKDKLKELEEREKKKKEDEEKKAASPALKQELPPVSPAPKQEEKKNAQA